MHDYDCPCPTCHLDSPTDRLLERVLAVIERLEYELSHTEPPRAEHEMALEWLAAVCGGADAVARLDAAPLNGAPSVPHQPRLSAAASLLDTVAGDLFDAETGFAFRRALARLWRADPVLVTGPASATYVAGGLIWAVGEANGLVGPGRPLTAARLKRHLDTPAVPSTYARPIIAALRGPWAWQAGPPSGAVRRASLLPLGCPDLLLGRVREQLVRVREHARQAAEATR